MTWYGNYTEGYYENGVPYPRRCCGGGQQIKNTTKDGDWCPFLMEKNEHHWIEFDISVTHQECSKRKCSYRLKLYGMFKCLYFVTSSISLKSSGNTFNEKLKNLNKLLKQQFSAFHKQQIVAEQATDTTNDIVKTIEKQLLVACKRTYSSD